VLKAFSGWKEVRNKVNLTFISSKSSLALSPLVGCVQVKFNSGIKQIGLSRRHEAMEWYGRIFCDRQRGQSNRGSQLVRGFTTSKGAGARSEAMECGSNYKDSSQFRSCSPRVNQCLQYPLCNHSPIIVHLSLVVERSPKPFRLLTCCGRGFFRFRKQCKRPGNL